MTLTWATIPREILYQILELLKDYSKTMIQLQLSCKNWQPLAQAIMYRAIRLPPANDPRASLLIESLQLPDKDYASKVIEIRFSSYSTLDRNNLVQIIRSCPNAKCVEQATYDQPDNHYPMLLQLYRQGYLRDLEKVRIPEFKHYWWGPRNNHTIEDYIHLMLELKESAKQLYVSFNHPTDGSVSLIPALEEFKHLKEIIFEESDGISFTQLDQVLRGKHPLLRKVAVSASKFIANEQDNAPITTALPHIKVLKLDLDRCSTKHLNLVQLMFPALQKLYIGTDIGSGVSFDNLDDENDTAKEDIEAFFGFVSRTKTFDVTISSLDSTSIEHMLRITSQQLRIFSVAINITPGWIHSDFNIFTSSAGYKGQQASHTKEGSLICHVRITLRTDQVSENACQSLLKALAEDVNPCIVIIDDDDYRRDISMPGLYKSVFGNYIDYILTQFKDLKALKLSNMSLAMEASASPAVTKKTLELEELEILKCKVPALFFEQLSRKINSIKTLNIGLIKVESAILNGLSMPHTRLQILHLDQNFKSCKLSIFLNAASAHVCVDAYGHLKLATYYSNGAVSTFSLRCIALSELDTTSHRMLLRSNNGRIDVFQQIKC